MNLLKIVLMLVLCLACFPHTKLFGFTHEEKQQLLARIKQIKKTGGTVYALVPKNTEEPFFEMAAQGCIETAQKMGVHCVYYGTTEENMRNQIRDLVDLIDAGVDGMAVSAVKKGYIAQVAGARIKQWGKPIIGFDSALDAEISPTYIGSNNYLLGKALGEEIRKLKPDGGSYCIQTERPDSPNHSDRLRGIVAGMTHEGKEQAKWSEVIRCPQNTFGNFARGIDQMTAVLKSYQVDVFASTGGGVQFLPVEYRQAMAPFHKDILSGRLVFASIDTVPAQLAYLKEGLATVNVGQRPYEMGKWSIIILQMLTKGEKVPVVINTGFTYCTQQTVENCTE